MDYLIVVLLQVGTSVAELTLTCLGLAIILGMMGVINFAHGEFMMLGAYTAIEANQHGLNIWLAMLVVAPLTVGAAGLAVERLVVCRLYGRLVDTMLATWGISLALIGLVTIAFGSTISGISSPLGSLRIGIYTTGAYEAMLIPLTLIMVGTCWAVLRFSRFGLIARGTMQQPEIAASLGISPPLVYAVTFGIGSALAGLAGALLAPLTGVVPTMGASYIARAFITVVSGGSSVLTGTVIASGIFGSVNTIVTFLTNSAIGDVALLAMALVVIRRFPRGITDRFMRGAV